MYGHVATTSIPDPLYARYMAELQAVCYRMDHSHAGSLMSATPRQQTYTQTLQYIQVMCMDPDSEARYTDEVRRMRETDRETRDLISGNVIFRNETKKTDTFSEVLIVCI